MITRRQFIKNGSILSLGAALPKLPDKKIYVAKWNDEVISFRDGYVTLDGKTRKLETFAAKQETYTDYILGHKPKWNIIEEVVTLQFPFTIQNINSVIFTLDNLIIDFTPDFYRQRDGKTLVRNTLWCIPTGEEYQYPCWKYPFNERYVRL